MHSLLTAALSYIERDVDGTKYKFSLLSMYDRAELSSAALLKVQAEHDAIKAKLVENARHAGLTGPDLYEALTQHDLHRPSEFGEEAWLRFVEDALNVPAILERSLRKHHADDAARVAKVAAVSSRDVLLICGFELKPQAQAGENPEGGGNPQTPLTYATTPAA